MEARAEARRVPDHDDCSVHEPCAAGMPEHCRYEAVRRLRAKLKVGGWSALETRRESGGLRHYLDGKPVHCGAGLELQHTAERSDNYGEFDVPLQVGEPVRYEASWFGDEVKWTLYVCRGGTLFVTNGQPWMRFRWPGVTRG